MKTLRFVLLLSALAVCLCFLAGCRKKDTADVAALEQQLAEAQARIDELESQQDRQSTPDAQNGGEQEDLEAAYAAKAAELETLQAAYNATAAELEALQATLSLDTVELQAAYAAKVAELTTLQTTYAARIAELEEELAGKEQTIALLQQEMETFPTTQSLYTFELKNDGTYALATAAADITEAVIPTRYKSVPVTQIGAGAFQDCRALTSVTIPDGVTSIGRYAFSGCTGLTSIAIPTGVVSIGEGAFAGCTDLAGVYIADLAKWCDISFGNYQANPLCCAHKLYLNNELIKTLVIPDGIKSIGDFAFAGYASMTNVTIPDSVTSIGKYSFSGCTGLTTIAVPAGVVSIGESAFDDCANLTVVYITDLAKWCGISFGNANANPLYYAHNLYLNHALIRTLVIPDGVTRIGQYVFQSCTGLTSISLASSLTYLDAHAFRGCGQLETIAFRGTKAQWSALIQKTDWEATFNLYAVTCTDGIVPALYTVGSFDVDDPSRPG